MRILVLSQYYFPEEFIINDFARRLKSLGHHVEILTGFPNYPRGSFFSGYGIRGPYKEIVDGIVVHRCLLFPRGNANGLRLLANYASFAATACLRIARGFPRRFDVILAFQMSPITIGIPARLLRFTTGAKLYFWIQDLWPESIIATGVNLPRLCIPLANSFTRWVYRGCDRLLTQSPSFFASVVRHGGNPKRIHYFPNYTEIPLYAPPSPELVRRLDAIPSGFNIMFAGNIGKAQALEVLLNAAEMCRGHPRSIYWLIVGDGSRRAWVESEIQKRGLTNVLLLGRFSRAEMNHVFQHASILLVSLRKDPVLALTIPSKVQAYLLCGKPIIASLDGEGARIVRVAQAGIATPAGDPISLSQAVIRLSESSTHELEAMGRCGKAFCEQHFSPAITAQRLSNIFSLDALTGLTQPQTTPT